MYFRRLSRFSPHIHAIAEGMIFTPALDSVYLYNALSNVP